MNYCSACGKSVELRIPDGDNLLRYCCDACGAIHYQNPRVIAGTLVTQAGRILMCKRNIEPRKGLWTLPAGFMENGESLDEAARRETLEETRLQVRTTSLHAVFSLPHINQVYVFLCAEVVSGEPAPTPESSEVRMIAPEEIPWDQIAFPTVARALRFHLGDIEAAPPLLENVFWDRAPNSTPQVRFEQGFGS